MNAKKDKELITLLSNWLKPYSDHVIKKVMLEKIDEVKSNEFTLYALKELYEREKNEQNDFANSIGHLYYDYENFCEYDVHNHPLSHAHSYRDVLYDMYIK